MADIYNGFKTHFLYRNGYINLPHTAPTVKQKKERRTSTMRFIPIGIADSRCMDGFLNPSDYSDKYYDGVQLRKSPKDNLVLIMRSKHTAPMDWKVVYGFSSVFFHTFEEAADFCSKRGMKAVKRQSENCR